MNDAAKLYHILFPHLNFYNQKNHIQQRYVEAATDFKQHIIEEARKEWFKS